MNTLRLALAVGLLPLAASAATTSGVKLVQAPVSKVSILVGAPWAALRSPKTLSISELKLAPQFKLPLIAAVETVSPVKRPPVITSLSNLSQIGDLPLRALSHSFKIWDGGEDHQGAEEHAYHEQRKKEEKRELRMERALVDYRPSALYDAGASEFLERSFDMGGERTWTGRELLSLLLTPHAIVDGLAPDPTQVDFGLFGRSDAELREILESRGIVPTLFHEMLAEAFNAGLIYRLNVAALQKTYYGVPYPVRKALGVEAPEAPKKEAAENTDAGAFVTSLLRLAAETAERADDDELFEFAAQAVHSAVAEGVLPQEAVPAGLREKLDAFPGDGEKLSHALLTFLESAQYTGLADEAEAACRAAVAAGLLDEAEFEKALRGR